MVGTFFPTELLMVDVRQRGQSHLRCCTPPGLRGGVSAIQSPGGFQAVGPEPQRVGEGETGLACTEPEALDLGATWHAFCFVHYYCRDLSVVKLFGPTDRREFRPRVGGLGV